MSAGWAAAVASSFAEGPDGEPPTPDLAQVQASVSQTASLRPSGLRPPSVAQSQPSVAQPSAEASPSESLFAGLPGAGAPGLLGAGSLSQPGGFSLASVPVGVSGLLPGKLRTDGNGSRTETETDGRGSASNGNGASDALQSSPGGVLQNLLNRNQQAVEVHAAQKKAEQAARRKQEELQLQRENQVSRPQSGLGLATAASQAAEATAKSAAAMAYQQGQRASPADSHSANSFSLPISNSAEAMVHQQQMPVASLPQSASVASMASMSRAGVISQGVRQLQRLGSAERLGQQQMSRGPGTDGSPQMSPGDPSVDLVRMSHDSQASLRQQDLNTSQADGMYDNQNQQQYPDDDDNPEDDYGKKITAAFRNQFWNLRSSPQNDVPLAGEIP